MERSWTGTRWHASPGGCGGGVSDGVRAGACAQPWSRRERSLSSAHSHRLMTDCELIHAQPTACHALTLSPTQLLSPHRCSAPTLNGSKVPPCSSRRRTHALTADFCSTAADYELLLQQIAESNVVESVTPPSLPTPALAHFLSQCGLANPQGHAQI